MPQTLAPGASYSCSFPLAISGNAGESKTDVVAGSGTNEEGTPVSGKDDATVRITDVVPAIVVTKTADPVSLPEPGGSVTYTVKVENASPASSDPLTLSSLLDDTFGNLHGKGSRRVVPQTIAFGGSYTCSFRRTWSGTPVSCTRTS